MNEQSFYSELIDKLKPEFELIHPCCPNPLDVWSQSAFGKFSLPHDLELFYKAANGMKRVQEDQYFTFQLHPLEDLKLFVEYMEITEDDVEDFSEELEMRSVNDWVIIGSEGEYGVYTVNCNPSSEEFGVVAGVVVNIPENFGTWPSFKAFAEGLPAYCNERPLDQYKDEMIASYPSYGFAL